MSDAVDMTIVFQDAGDGWITATIPEVPGALSQGRTRAEARENVLEAMRELLAWRSEDALRASEGDTADREPLHFVNAA